MCTRDQMVDYMGAFGKAIDIHEAYQDAVNYDESGIIILLRARSALESLKEFEKIVPEKIRKDLSGKLFPYDNLIPPKNLGNQYLNSESWDAVAEEKGYKNVENLFSANSLKEAYRLGQGISSEQAKENRDKTFKVLMNEIRENYPI